MKIGLQGVGVGVVWGLIVSFAPAGMAGADPLEEQLLARGTAEREEEDSGYVYYAELYSGFSIVPEQGISGGGLAGDVSFGPGFHVGGAVGARISDHLRSELSLGYRQSDVDEIDGPGIRLEGAGDAGVFTAMANGYVDLLPDAAVIPYVGAGIGVGVVSINSDNDASLLVVDDSDVVFAWNLMAGVGVPVTDHFSITLGYRYLATTDPDLEATVNIPGVGRASGTLTGEFDAHEGVFGVRLGF